MIYCSKPCSFEHRTGFDHPLKNPAVKKRVARTCLHKYGVTSPSKLESVKQKKRKTSLANYGVYCPLLAPEVKKAVRKTWLKNYGVDNPSKCPEVIQRIWNTWCGVHPMWTQETKNKVVDTNMSRYGVRNPSQRPEIRERAELTNLDKFGVRNVMQNADVFKKQMKSQHRIKAGSYQGRDYEYQGWEHTIFEKLVDLYGTKNVVTQFDTGYPEWVMSEAGTWPDLYVSSLKLFVEVKSLWTLYGGIGTGTLRKNKAKAEALEASGNKCRWVVVTHPAKKSYVILPRKWYRWTRGKLERFIEEKRTK